MSKIPYLDNILSTAARRLLRCVIFSCTRLQIWIRAHSQSSAAAEDQSWINASSYLEALSTSSNMEAAVTYRLLVNRCRDLPTITGISSCQTESTVSSSILSFAAGLVSTINAWRIASFEAVLSQNGNCPEAQTNTVIPKLNKSDWHVTCDKCEVKKNK